MALGTVSPHPRPLSLRGEGSACGTLSERLEVAFWLDFDLHSRSGRATTGGQICPPLRPDERADTEVCGYVYSALRTPMDV
jgi:hypothetical protein